MSQLLGFWGFHMLNPSLLSLSLSANPDVECRSAPLQPCLPVCHASCHASIGLDLWTVSQLQLNTFLYNNCCDQGLFTAVKPKLNYLLQFPKDLDFSNLKRTKNENPQKHHLGFSESLGYNWQCLKTRTFIMFSNWTNKKSYLETSSINCILFALVLRGWLSTWLPTLEREDQCHPICKCLHFQAVRHFTSC